MTRNILRDRIIEVGEGENRPIADNNTAAGRQANRRVETLLERWAEPFAAFAGKDLVLVRKLAGAVGVALAFNVLDWAGFESGKQNDGTVLWILRAMTALVPVLFVIASMWVAMSATSS